MKLLIIGGVAGGATAATRARRLDEKAEIVMLERGPYVSFANCGLPYHVGGVIAKRESLLLISPEAFEKRMGIDVRVKNEALSIDRAAKKVKIRNHISGEDYFESYDKLIIATGSRPALPSIPVAAGLKLETLWNIEDMDKMLATLKTGVKKVAILGGGFIGVELAENLRERGFAVTLIQRSGHLMPNLDVEMARPLAEELVANGIELLLNSAVTAVEKSPSGAFRVVLDGGRHVDADLCASCVGVKPNSELAKAAGLSLGFRDGIVVDETMRTDDPDVFAVGDAVQVRDLALDQPAMIPLAGPANRQGRVAADNVFGVKSVYKGSQGTSVIKVFGMTAASTGANEARLKQAGRDFIKVYLHPFNHAGYYPGGEQMVVKALFEKSSGKLLGAQIVGGSGVDKRIDVLATALRHGLTADDLAELELAYAPPYGSAKDPVNMIGFVAGNVLSGRSSVVHADAIPAGSFLLDVRESAEFEAGSLPGAVNIPLATLRSRLSELPKDRKIVVFCRSGQRSYNAERILKANGFDVANLSGAYLTWRLFNPGELKNNPAAPSPALSSGTPGIVITPAPERVPSQGASCAALDAAGRPLEGSSCCALPPVSQSGAESSIDVRGLQCPGPIVAVKKAVETLPEGGVLEIKADAGAFTSDLPVWCKSYGLEMLSITKNGRVVDARIRKGGTAAVQTAKAAAVTVKRANIVLFSGDLDKAMAAFIIATGFATLGHEVSIFCTFWGLNALRKDDPPQVEKDFLSWIFGFMMPCGAKKLALSKMNMLGLGTAMMKNVMAMKNVDDLPTLIKNAREMGVKLLACEMAMNVMGIHKEELLDGVEVAGVANFAGLAEQGGPTLFI